MEKMWIFQSGRVYGAFYTVQEGQDTRPIYRNAELWRDDLRDADGGLTCVRVIITKDTAGRVSVAWFHEDLTDGRDNPYSDIEYDLPREGFWAAVQEHAALMEAGDFPPECMD